MHFLESSVSQSSHFTLELPEISQQLVGLQLISLTLEMLSASSLGLGLFYKPLKVVVFVRVLHYTSYQSKNYQFKI